MDEKKWKDVYSTKFGGMWTPNEGFVKYSARYLKRRVGIAVYDTKKEAHRILDAGCGGGRHVKFFAEQGFDVYGMDLESEAIDIAKAWMSKEGLKADLRVGDLEKLPFDDGYFDVIVSFGVLDHVFFSKAKKIMGELKRVLAPNGYFFVSLRSTEDSEFGRGEKKDHNTFVLAEGYEKGIIQHYFDVAEMKELFDGFKLFDVELYETRFPELFTLDKSFLQSSKGTKTYVDLSKSLDLNLKGSRWYVAAEKE